MQRSDGKALVRKSRKVVQHDALPARASRGETTAPATGVDAVLAGYFADLAERIESRIIELLDSPRVERPATAEQLAEHWQLSTRTVYTLREREGLPAMKVGDTYRYLISECDAWARSRGER